MNKLTKYSTAFFLLILLLFFSSCSKKKPSRVMPVPEISVAVPQVRDITLTKEYPGYLTSEQTVKLMARVNGTLQSVQFTPGSRVKKGALLFVIEPTLYKDAVSKAEAALSTARAQLEYTTNSYERMKEAAQSDAVSEIQVIQSGANVTEASAAVNNALAGLNTANTNLSYCYLRAPFSGTIDRNQFDEGNYISGGMEPVTLATLYKNERMYVYFNIEESQYMKMRQCSDSVTIRTTDNSGVSFRKTQKGTLKGTLDYLSPEVDLATGTMAIRAMLPNKDNILKSGLYVLVSLPYGEKKDAVLVSDASIGTDQLGKYLYLVNDSDRVQYRTVQLGELVTDSLREIVSGLSPAERYVTTALLKVRNGMKVKPVK